MSYRVSTLSVPRTMSNTSVSMRPTMSTTTMPTNSISTSRPISANAVRERAVSSSATAFSSSSLPRRTTANPQKSAQPVEKVFEQKRELTVEPSLQQVETQTVIAPFAIHRNNGALSVRVIRPRFVQRARSIVLDKSGGIMLEFAKSVGQRKYDWANKGIFAIKDREIGSILAAGANAGVSLVHDSHMDGKVIKTLGITPGRDGSVFFNLKVTDKVTSTNSSEFSVSASKEDYAIFLALMNQCVPHLFGWSLMWDPVIANAPLDNTSVSD